jgi:ribosomal protein L37AE/L43A
MTQPKHAHTVPSDAHPACPSCESDVFVDCRSYEDALYYCNLCGHTFKQSESPDRSVCHE